MSIPLDRLYHYIESVAQKVHSDTLIYRFWPHGSKKIEDLSLLYETPNINYITNIHLICHDQEPLNYDLYAECVGRGIPRNQTENRQTMLSDDINFLKTNLRNSPNNIYDKCLLLHSEINSPEVEKYANDQFIPVYYWNHAVLARDWYRYANHVKLKKNPTTKTFLIYNRAWTGTREYRMKLADLLIDHQLVDQCLTSFSFNDHDTDVYYTQHKFINNKWQPRHQLELHYQSNTYPACSSADFDLTDYQSTDIELVSETLFDDSRIHLTEKSLRPIALGQPFILAGPVDSLKYLKNYGFKTFDSVIDESYDDIVDPSLRLTAIVELMSSIKNLPPTQYQELLIKLNEIVEYNKNYFFSDKFFKTINDELINNISTGIDQLLTTNTYERFLTYRSTMLKNDNYIQWRNSAVPAQDTQYADQIYQKLLSLKNQ